MEELRKIARAHYQASSKKVQDLANEFFKTMDSDGDDKIDLAEFLELMREEGHHQMRNRYFFKELDVDGNGTLDFWEVMTVYYIIKSGRPFCDFCGNFIPGIFFSCVECHKRPKSSFTLCLGCYQSAKCNHNHNGHIQFLDNYTLLQVQKESPQATQINHNEPTYNINVERHQYPVPSTSTAIVLAKQASKRVTAYQALQVALTIGNIYTTAAACAIL